LVGTIAEAEEGDYCVPELKWEDRFITVLSGKTEWQQETPLRRNELSLYTDGLKTKEGSRPVSCAQSPEHRVYNHQ